MTLKSDAKFEEKLICCFKNDKNYVNFEHEHSKFSKYPLWLVLFCVNYITFDLKKYRGVIFHDTAEWCKIWAKTELWFGKWHEEYGKFSPEHLKISKLGLWWDPFIQSRKCMSLKFTEELCIMTMKNDGKFEEELTCRFQSCHEEFDKFWPEHSKVSKICT